MQINWLHMASHPMAAPKPLSQFLLCLRPPLSLSLSLYRSPSQYICHIEATLYLINTSRLTAPNPRTTFLNIPKNLHHKVAFT